jgi:hypothetical protein
LAQNKADNRASCKPSSHVIARASSVLEQYCTNSASREHHLTNINHQDLQFNSYTNSVAEAIWAELECSCNKIISLTDILQQPKPMEIV